MPGSSGSAIYNSDEEVSALVFAGGNGFTSAVPYEYIMDFIKNLYLSSNITPNYIASADSLFSKSSLKDFSVKCKTTKKMNNTIKSICKIIERDVKWREHEEDINSYGNLKSYFPNIEPSSLPQIGDSFKQGRESSL
jgi:hypothetical protein